MGARTTVSALAWVVGRGGLLGSQVLAALNRSREVEPWQAPVPRMSWAEQSTVTRQLRLSAQGLIERAVHQQRPWTIIWCAGAGVVGTAREALAGETAVWTRFLDDIGATLDEPGGRHAAPGHVVLISSAGGLYGGGRPPFSEASPTCPVSDYGRAKLRQEEALAAWSRRRTGVSTLVVRVSNLYGPGQKVDKPQGLISHMARSVIRQQPIHVFVPLDTVRDYVFAEDAGIAIAGWAERLAASSATGGPQHVVKLCASGQDTTISTLVGVFFRVARRRVRLVCGLHPSGALQPRQLRFRSQVWTEKPVQRTGLLEGVSRVYREQLSLYQAGAFGRASAHLPLAASQTPRTKPVA